jgi:DNA-binding transcriptional LysR family regulator
MIDEISGDFLQWLRGFYFVAEKGNLRQAAIAMGREQPTISRQIRCLEKELGVTLFDRSSGKMMITPEGKILQKKADELFEYLKQTKDEFKNKGINYRGNIFIATTSPVAYNILPPYVDHFQRLHPKVTFQIEGTSRKMVYEKVESAEADFGICVLEHDYKTLEPHDLFTADIVMIAPRNTIYFPGKTLPTLKQIAEAPLILLARQGMHQRMIEERFAKDQLKLNVVQSHNNFVNVKRYVAQGMGIAILSEINISQEDEQSFDIYSLEPYFPKWKYGILVRKKKYLSAMVKEFIRTIKPDIDFSANLEPSEAPVLSLTEFRRREVGLN